MLYHSPDMHRPQQRIRFGLFDVDVRSGELRRQSVRIDLQDQPFQALVLLLERPGEVVTREELKERLWPEDTHVDFDRGLNKAINKLRAALKDDADHPRFIETLPQRGYRFLAPVERVEDREPESGLLESPRPPVMAESSDPILRSSPRPVLAWGAAVCLALFAAWWSGTQWRVREGATNKPFLHFDLDVGPEEFSQPAISSDGTRIAFVSKGAVVLRRFDQTSSTRLAGTEGGFFPFFSPDGKWIAFFAAGKLQKVALDGGTPVVLCGARNPGGGTWTDDEHIVAALDVHVGGLSRISATGGLAKPLTDFKSDPSGPLNHLWPQALPGGKALLFSAVNGSAQGSLRILTLADGKVKTVVENATRGRYLPTGHLVYFWRSRLYAVPIDPKRWEASGPPVSLISGVSNAGGFGRGEFDLSDSGTLVYREDAVGTSFVVSWLFPSGKTEPVLAKPESFLTPRLSPDGNRLAIAMVEEDKQSLWVYDIGRETWSRLTSETAPELLPTWSPDGSFIAFRSGETMAWTRSDGSGSIGRLAGVNANVAPWSFSGDGKWLSFWPLQPGSDLWGVDVTRSPGAMRLGKPKLLLAQAGSKGAPAISPDSRWVAYSSNESGHFEIYVIPFSPDRSDVSGKWLVSSGGGLSPMWSKNNRELLYQGLDRRVWAAAYRVQGDSFLADKPRIWSDTLLGETGIFNAFDVAPDGDRVIALLAAAESRDRSIVRVVLNLDSGLGRPGRSVSKP